MQNLYTSVGDEESSIFSVDRREDGILPSREDEEIKLSENFEVIQGYLGGPNIGSHIPVWIKDNKIIMTLGPHWYVFLLGFSLLSGLGVYVAYFFWGLFSIEMKIGFSFAYTFEMCLYFATALSNPGIITRKVPVFGKGKLVCTDCLTTEEDQAHHCDLCGVCIQRHDHHCVWIGKCVGQNNYHLFMVFVVFTPFYFVTLFLGTISGS